MNVKELRIGNLISGLYDNSDGKQCQNICEVLAVDLTESLGDGWSFLVGAIDGDEETETYDTFEPIPLTEDWLKKFKFRRLNNAWNGPTKSTDFSIWNPDGEEYTLNDSVMCPKIVHVHQLQNMYFILTGEELVVSGVDAKQSLKSRR